MTIQCHNTLLLALSLIGTLACTPTSPTPAAQPAPKSTAEPPTAPVAAPDQAPAVRPAPTVRAPRPIRAAAPRDKLHLTRTTGSVESPLPYTIVAPSNGPPELPIIIALHGRGDRAEGFCRLVERLRLPYRFIVVEAPMRWGLGSGKQWFDMKAPDRPEQLRRRVDELKLLTEKLAKRWPKAPIPSLLGFSQGAMLALQAVAQRPALFTGVIALSGGLVETEGLSPVSVKRPVWLSAGESDRIVSPDLTERAAATLSSLGHQTEVFRFKGGHTVTDEVVSRIRDTLKQWYARVPDKPGAGGDKKRAR